MARVTEKSRICTAFRHSWIQGLKTAPSGLIASVSSGLVSFSGRLSPHEASGTRGPRLPRVPASAERCGVLDSSQTESHCTLPGSLTAPLPSDWGQGMKGSHWPGLVTCSPRSGVGGVSPTWSAGAERKEENFSPPTRSGGHCQKEEQTLSHQRQPLPPQKTDDISQAPLLSLLTAHFTGE